MRAYIRYNSVIAGTEIVMAFLLENRFEEDLNNKHEGWQFAKETLSASYLIKLHSPDTYNTLFEEWLKAEGWQGGEWISD